MNKKKKNKKTILLIMLGIGLFGIGSKVSATKITFKNHELLSSIVTKFGETGVTIDQRRLLNFLDQIKIRHNKTKINEKFIFDYNQTAGTYAITKSDQTTFKLVHDQASGQWNLVEEEVSCDVQFFQAVCSGNYDLAKDLLDRGLIDPNSPLDCGTGDKIKPLPLSLAVSYKNFKLIDLLFAKGADPTLTDYLSPNDPVVLDHHAAQPINYCFFDGITLRFSDSIVSEIIKNFCDHGYNPYLNYNGYNVLSHLLRTQDQRSINSIFSYLKSKSFPFDFKSDTLLSLVILDKYECFDCCSKEAIERYKLNSIKYLIDQGFDINQGRYFDKTDLNFLTPTVYAITAGYNKIFKFLIHRPEFVSKQLSEISFELLKAVEYDNVFAVNELLGLNQLGQGIKINVTTDMINFAKETPKTDPHIIDILKKEYKRQHPELFAKDDLESSAEEIVNLPEEDKLKAIDQKITEIDEEEQSEISESSSASDLEDSNEATEVVAKSSEEDLVKKDQVTDVESNVSSPNSPSLEEQRRQAKQAKKLARQQGLALRNGFNRRNLEQKINDQFDLAVKQHQQLSDKLAESQLTHSITINLHANDQIFADPHNHHLNPISYAHTCFDIIKEYVQAHDLHDITIHGITGWGAHAASHHSLTQDALLQLAKKYEVCSRINSDNIGDVVLEF